MGSTEEACGNKAARGEAAGGSSSERGASPPVTTASSMQYSSTPTVHAASGTFDASSA